MITDLRSFLAGVQVGRRLKVADAQRELSKKPVDSGLKILAENGTPIITENPIPTDKTIYYNGGLYPAYTTSGVPGCKVGIVRVNEYEYDEHGRPVELPSEMQYFWWATSWYNRGQLILYSPRESDIANATYWMPIFTPEGIEISPTHWITILSAQHVGDLYMINLAERMWADEDDNYYTIDGIEPYIGPPADFFEMMENAQPKPLITE